MNEFQQYFIDEFVQVYKAGGMSRRDMMKRVLYITGGVASTASLLTLMGCGTSSSPAASSAAPAASSAAAKPASSAATSAAASAPASAKPAASGAASAKPAASGSAAASPSAGTQPAPKSPLSVPANDPAVSGKDVTFSGNGTDLMVYEARPAKPSGPLAVVLVCEENAGVTEHIKDMTRRFAKAGYLGVALDMLSRDGGTAKQDPARIPALLSDQAHVANQVGDWKAVMDYYLKQPGVANAVAMTGYCFGGGVVYKVATQIPTLKAVAPYYGASPGADAAKNIKAAVWGVYDSDPNDGSSKTRAEVDAALTAANVPHQLKVYPGTTHGFNNDTRPTSGPGLVYNEEQALAAWKDVQDWFGKYLKP